MTVHSAKQPRRSLPATGQVVSVLANLGLKVGAAALAFLVSITVARQLGMTEAGIFFFAQNVIVLLVATSRFGLDNSLIREAARLDSTQDLAHLQVIFSTGTTVMTAAALAIVLFAVTIGFGLDQYGLLLTGGYVHITLVLVTGLPFLAFAAATGFFLQATSHVALSTFLLFAAQPAMHLLLLLGFWPETALAAAWLFVVSAALTAAFAVALVWRFLVGISLKPRLREFSADTLRGTGSLWGVSLTNQAIALLPMLMLSLFATSADVALFAIALRVAGLTGNIVVAINSVFARRIAQLFTTHPGRAFRSALAAQGYTFAIGAPLLLVLLLFPVQILALFGKGFHDAWLALVIITLGQFFNVATSATSMVLAMGGKEGAMFRAGLFVLCATLLAGLAVIPPLQLTGASLVSVGSLILINSIYTFHVLRPFVVWRTNADG